MNETDIFDLIFNFWVGFAVLMIILVKSSIKFVPQNRVFVVERFGKFNKSMEAGLNFLVPFIDKVAYDRSLKEQAVDVPSQGAITRDNISLIVDGVLYLKVLDPYKASYGVDNYVYAVMQLAQTTMRSEIGKIELDKTFEDREVLNVNIVSQINEASAPWGVQVLRYEIKDIEPPRTVLDAMERQMKAEREKRAQILEAEGAREAAIQIAEGEKESAVLHAEGELEAAKREAEARERLAEAEARATEVVSQAIANGDPRAINYFVAQKYIDALGQLAASNNNKVMMIPLEAASVIGSIAGISEIAKEVVKDATS